MGKILADFPTWCVFAKLTTKPRNEIIHKTVVCNLRKILPTYQFLVHLSKFKSNEQKHIHIARKLF